MRVAHAHNSSVIIYSNHLTYQALRSIGLDDQAISIVRFEVEQLFKGTVLEQWYQGYDQFIAVLFDKHCLLVVCVSVCE